jgi:hypothetical protein
MNTLDQASVTKLDFSVAYCLICGTKLRNLCFYCDSAFFFVLSFFLGRPFTRVLDCLGLVFLGSNWWWVTPRAGLRRANSVSGAKKS